MLVACNKKEEAKLPYYNAPDLTPVWDAGKGSSHTIADFSFTDQEGNAITNETFNDRVYVADFFFTICPGICPKMTANMQTLADAYKDNDEVKFISHSVTPYTDSVPRLKEYATQHDIDAQQWHLVTGSKGDIYDLARRSYFAEDEIGFNSDSTEFLHTERFVLVDKDRHIRGVYNGTVALEMERLKEDINTLLQQ